MDFDNFEDKLNDAMGFGSRTQRLSEYIDSMGKHVVIMELGPLRSSKGERDERAAARKQEKMQRLKDIGSKGLRLKPRDKLFGDVKEKRAREKEYKAGWDVRNPKMPETEAPPGAPKSMPEKRPLSGQAGSRSEIGEKEDQLRRKEERRQGRQQKVDTAQDAVEKFFADLGKAGWRYSKVAAKGGMKSLGGALKRVVGDILDPEMKGERVQKWRSALSNFVRNLPDKAKDAVRHEVEQEAKKQKQKELSRQPNRVGTVNLKAKPANIEGYVVQSIAKRFGMKPVQDAKAEDIHAGLRAIDNLLFESYRVLVEQQDNYKVYKLEGDGKKMTLYIGDRTIKIDVEEPKVEEDFTIEWNPGAVSGNNKDQLRKKLAAHIKKRIATLIGKVDKAIGGHVENEQLDELKSAIESEIKNQNFDMDSFLDENKESIALSQPAMKFLVKRGHAKEKDGKINYDDSIQNMGKYWKVDDFPAEGYVRVLPTNMKFAYIDVRIEGDSIVLKRFWKSGGDYTDAGTVEIPKSDFGLKFADELGKLEAAYLGSFIQQSPEPGDVDVTEADKTGVTGDDDLGDLEDDFGTEGDVEEDDFEDEEEVDYDEDEVDYDEDEDEEINEPVEPGGEYELDLDSGKARRKRGSEGEQRSNFIKNRKTFLEKKDDIMTLAKAVESGKLSEEDRAHVVRKAKRKFEVFRNAVWRLAGDKLVDMWAERVNGGLGPPSKDDFEAVLREVGYPVNDGGLFRKMYRTLRSKAHKEFTKRTDTLSVLESAIREVNHLTESSEYKIRVPSPDGDVKSMSVGELLALGVSEETIANALDNEIILMQERGGVDTVVNAWWMNSSPSEKLDSYASSLTKEERLEIKKFLNKGPNREERVQEIISRIGGEDDLDKWWVSMPESLRFYIYLVAMGDASSSGWKIKRLDGTKRLKAIINNHKYEWFGEGDPREQYSKEGTWGQPGDVAGMWDDEKDVPEEEEIGWDITPKDIPQEEDPKDVAAEPVVDVPGDEFSLDWLDDEEETEGEPEEVDDLGSLLAGVSVSSSDEEAEATDLIASISGPEEPASETEAPASEPEPDDAGLDWDSIMGELEPEQEPEEPKPAPKPKQKSKVPAKVYGDDLDDLSGNELADFLDSLDL